MPLLRYRYWDSDGLTAKKAIVGNREYSFFDADHGVCFIPSKKDADWLLRNSINYEVAWDRYGVTFDAKGNEVVPVTAAAAATEAIAVSHRLPASVVDAPVVSKRGRPRKG